MDTQHPEKTSPQLLLAIALCMVGAVIPIESIAANVLPAFDASYVLRTKGLKVGMMRRRLEPQPSTERSTAQFIFQSETKASGLIGLWKTDRIVETSTWRHRGEEIEAISYRYQRLGGRKPREDTTDFSWQRGLVTGVHKNRSWQTALPANTVDKLLYQLLLMRDLGRNQLQPEYQIADGGRIKSYQISREGEELVKTPLGEFQTVKLRRGRADQNRRTTFWCAPSLGYLPVRVDYREKDGVVTSALLKQLTGIQHTTE